ncbi:hypothetical protein DFJ67_7934 [Asanoa ferruginea]|uniref:Transglutaminase superfamily protein n=1 Tax=Asanoa ferruginea TaxID=53367 RepID=A0A3D9ZYT7_9ACTN|nr:hypothetical protein [Asanoa ferruginea]REG01845.1 hypothetical protein DFJ67_7934 [Asanoa ferruginea]GIF50278.1 hypothetical protein Afe04nite_48170 [Asanoa ferruginea]
MNQSFFSDPGKHAALLDDLPEDFAAQGDGPDWHRVADLLDADQRRHPGRPLSAPRAHPFGASTRAASLLVVAALRRRGVPARCRVGFAPRRGYAPQVIATPGGRADDGFVLAGEVWLAYRDGVVDASRYGGGAAVRDAVLRDLAHANADEVPLAETWGPMGPDLVGDLDVIDDLAALLVATFLGDEVAERELAERYATDHRIRPPHALARAA